MKMVIIEATQDVELEHNGVVHCWRKGERLSVRAQPSSWNDYYRDGVYHMVCGQGVTVPVLGFRLAEAVCDAESNPKCDVEIGRPEGWKSSVLTCCENDPSCSACMFLMGDRSECTLISVIRLLDDMLADEEANCRRLAAVLMSLRESLGPSARARAPYAGNDCYR